MKLSEIRLSNIRELQAFLTENKVPFDTDMKKPELAELAKTFIESQPKQSPEELANLRAKEQERAKVAEGERLLEEEKQRLRDESAKKAAIEAERSKPQKPELELPGARREVPLNDLLTELSKKGFQNKQELADLLEAEARERRALELVRKDHDEREEKITKEELKLQQRIKDSEAEFAKIQVHRKQCEEMVAKAVAINAKNRA